MKRIFTFLALMLCLQLAKAQYPAFKTYDNISLGTLSVKLYGNLAGNPPCNRLNFTSNIGVPTSPSLLVMASTAPWSSPGSSSVINGFQYLENIGGMLVAGPVVSMCAIAPGTYAYTIPGGSTFNMIVEIETAPSCLKVRLVP